MSQTIPIKFQFDGLSCHRTCIVMPLSMSKINETLLTSFPSLCSKSFTIRYTDEEGDEIDICSDCELQEAAKVFQALGRVLFLSIVNSKPDDEQDKTTGTPTVYHSNCGRLPGSEMCLPHDHHRHNHLRGKFWQPFHGRGRHLHRGRGRGRGRHLHRARLFNHWKQRHLMRGQRHCFIPMEEEHPDLSCTLIEHTSFPDGSTLLPKQSFEKKWRVKTGAKAWPAGCLLKHVGGHGMGTKRPKFQPTPLPALPAGLEIEISMSLVAPARARDFISKFRMHDPEGRAFGDIFWAKITVMDHAGRESDVHDHHVQLSPSRIPRNLHPNWAGWKGLNPIPTYAPIVNNINRLFTLCQDAGLTISNPDWTGWIGINPIPSYAPIVNNINKLFTILQNVPGITEQRPDWAGWKGLNPIPTYAPIVNNINTLFGILNTLANTDRQRLIFAGKQPEDGPAK